MVQCSEPVEDTDDMGQVVPYHHRPIVIVDSQLPQCGDVVGQLPYCGRGRSAGFEPECVLRADGQ